MIFTLKRVVWAIFIASAVLLLILVYAARQNPLIYGRFKKRRADKDYRDPKNRPWYMKNGVVGPNQEKYPSEDRVFNQLMLLPRSYNASNRRFKKFYVPPGLITYPVQPKIGQDLFIELKCPVNTCTVSQDNPSEADLVFVNDNVKHPDVRSPNQVWMLYLLESPFHTGSLKNLKVNWTATYRSDSDIPVPYGKWQYYNPKVAQMPQSINYAAKKTKKVAWFVSNCNARNKRLEYAKELGKYIQVDIYGSCGTLKCPRDQERACFEMLYSDYKFYLAFENSNCKDYITEKLFLNGLGHNVLPIVMGAPPGDYELAAPEHSYIHVDEFESPEKLAEYLEVLDRDDELYNSYFKWKGTGEILDDYFWCRLCAVVHDEPIERKSYGDVDQWWRAPGVCTTPNSWRG